VGKYRVLLEQLSLKWEPVFGTKNCGKNKELEQLTEPSEVKTALEPLSLKCEAVFGTKNCGEIRI